MQHLSPTKVTKSRDRPPNVKLVSANSFARFSSYFYFRYWLELLPDAILAVFGVVGLPCPNSSTNDVECDTETPAEPYMSIAVHVPQLYDKHFIL